MKKTVLGELTMMVYVSDTNAEKSILASIVFLLGVSLSANDVFAGELRVGTGINRVTELDDGSWRQTGMDYNRDDQRSVQIVQYANRLPYDLWGQRFDYTVGVAHRKGMKVGGGTWISDECYRGGNDPIYSGHLYSGTDCGDRTTTRIVETRTVALTFAAGPTFKFSKNVSASWLIGGSLYRIKDKLIFDNTRGLCSEKGGCEEGRYTKDDVSVYTEATVKYGDLFVSGYRQHRDSGFESGQKSSYGIVAGFSLPLK